MKITAIKIIIVDFSINERKQCAKYVDSLLNIGYEISIGSINNGEAFGEYSDNADNTEKIKLKKFIRI